MSAVLCPLTKSPEERLHAILSASGAHRWLTCSRSARLEEGLPDRGSAFSEEGTLAHHFGENELHHYLGNIKEADYQANLEVFKADKRVTPGFIADVMIYVTLAIDLIKKVREACPDAVIAVEQRLDFSHIVPEGFGTGDLVIVADGVMYVVDLKFGKGLEVSAVENEQEMLYGVGALNEYGHLYNIETVELWISQPRLNVEPSKWQISASELRIWAESVVKPAALRAWNGEGEFVPGDHCGFCRAKGSCRARAEANLALAQHEFKVPELLDENEIAAILDKADRLKKWAGDIQDYALKQAEHGHKFPGYKLVRGRSNRKYKDQDAVALALTGAGIPESVIFERSLLGITAMEKAITKKKFTELLTELVEKPLGKPVLVPASDDRPEIEGGAPIDGFEDIPE